MLNVIKVGKQIEPYSEEKILHSIKRAGIPEKIHNDVLKHVNSKVYDNIPSSEIYGHVTEFLGASDYPYSRSRYSLKQAIMDLGPTGYPFEDFISEILNSHGYNTEVRVNLMGKCVSHEVDIVAKKNERSILIEAKFHNSVGTRTDVHVPMYTKSRYEDIKDKYNLNESWIITNTKATTDAIAFAECVGMTIISWSYPEKGSLRELIESAGLHPITILSTLLPQHKLNLLKRHIIRCKSIHENPSILEPLGMSVEEKKKVLDEIEFVCKGEHR